MRSLFLVLFRLALGWLFFYAGVTKVFDPQWSPKGYLLSAKTLPALYAWLASPTVLPILTVVAAWSLFLLGLSLLLGIGIKISGRLGAVLMILFYLPVLSFPLVGEHSFLVDEHIIYALALLVLSSGAVQTPWSLGSRLTKIRFFASRPRLAALLR